MYKIVKARAKRAPLTQGSPDLMTIVDATDEHPQSIGFPVRIRRNPHRSAHTRPGGARSEPCPAARETIDNLMDNATAWPHLVINEALVRKMKRRCEKMLRGAC
jgi:hypothetical protein